jgi:hypothetical protein
MTRAGGPDHDREAAVFVAKAMRLLAENRYAAAWRALHPAHQRVVGQAEYARCESASAIPGTVRSLSVQRVRDERAAIPGIGRPLTKAVSVRLVIADDAVPEGVVVEHEAHVLQVGGRWRWVLPAARYAAYRDGRCSS